ncbi:MAG: hypothetical protein WBP61_05775 [Nocardioides sp.]
MAETSRQRLYLHVGLPKSGSTFLQSVVGGNRAALKEHGFVYPYVQQEGMFHAAVEMAGSPGQWGLTRAQVDGTFAAMLERGRRQGRTVVVSHEIFGAATPAQIEAIADQLTDFDVHLVVTVRNIARMFTAQWQERVKNGFDQTFAAFAEQQLEKLPPPGDPVMAGFWRGQNLAWLLDRWRPLAPPEQTHVVVSPSGGADPEVLWRRFAEALDFPADAIDVSSVPGSNESLGTPQIALLREVVGALDGRLEQPGYSLVAKRWFAQSMLSRVRSRKPVTPASVAEQLSVVARGWVELVESGGYRVHGDLAELLPAVPPPGTPHPDDVSAEEMLDGLPGVLAEMLLRVRDDRALIAELRAANTALEEQVADLTRPATGWRRWWPGAR